MKSNKTSLLAQVTWIVLLIAGLAELYFGMSDLNKTFTDVPEVFEQTTEALNATPLYKYSLPLAIGRILLGIATVLIAAFKSKVNKKLLLTLGILLLLATIPAFFLIGNTEKAFYYLGFTRAISLLCYIALWYFFKKGSTTS